MAMAPALLEALVLAITLRIWKFTVLCDRDRMQATSAAVLPAADHFSTSSSRSVIFGTGEHNLLR
ncbi:hypothetical protein D3C76_1141420 [compost metagenome]